MNTPIDIAALEELEKKAREKPDICGDDNYAGGVPNKARYRMELYAVAPQLLSELKELREKERIAVEALEFLLEAHFTVSEATVPKAGIEANPEQVVFNASISYLRLKRAREALAAIREKSRG